MKTASAVLIIVIFFCGCSNTEVKQEQDDRKGCSPCQFSEKCIALLAYGLLSDNENDVPFGGACNDIVPDSLVRFLQLQKRIFKSWQKTKEIDWDVFEPGMAYKGDIRLLQTLIFTRILMEKNITHKAWWINAGIMEKDYGSDYSFVHQFFMLGITYDATYFDTDRLNRITSFSDFVAYLDPLFVEDPDAPHRAISYWCKEVNDFAQELKKYSSGENFLLKYYDLRCGTMESSKK